MSMTASHLAPGAMDAEGPRVSLAMPGDFFALLKPRVMSLVVFTALVGMLVPGAAIHPVLAAVSLLAVAVGAGASGALNMWVDADIDAVMSRTRGRPIPSGRVTREEALGFGLFLSAASVLVLGIVANWLAAGLLAFTIFFYAVVYSMVLKRRTVQNIVIGGAAGAFPPMIGEAVATGGVGIAGLLLFAIIFVWTPPHFWALALLKRDDYARAGIPMLPVVAGEAATRRGILLYTLLLVPVGLSPLAFGMGGPAFALAAALGGAAMLGLSLRLWSAGEAQGRVLAGRLFGISILYLFALFAALLVEALAAVRPLLPSGILA